MFVHKNIQYYWCGQYKKNRGIKLFYTSAFIIKRSMALADQFLFTKKKMFGYCF